MSTFEDINKVNSCYSVSLSRVSKKDLLILMIIRARQKAKQSLVKFFKCNYFYI